MISSNNFRTGTTIKIEGDAWQVIDFQHVKPGKGAAFVRTKIKNLRTGAVVDRTFNAGEKMSKAHVEKHDMQYLYFDNNMFIFMDNNNYEQINLSVSQLGDVKKFLKENMNVSILFFEGVIVSIELPHSVELTVIETDPGVRGDTATGGTKVAKMETGHVVRVPLFIENGDLLRIDTRSGNYIERV